MKSLTIDNLNTESVRGRSYQPSPYLSSLLLPASAASEQLLKTSMRHILQSVSRPSTFVRPADSRRAASLEEKLYDALASFKIKTAAVAMHFIANERTRLFQQLDSLMAAESWDPADVPTSVESFTTLLRMILFLGGRRPALGATDTGNFIATWTEGTDRLTIECKANDHVRYILIQNMGGERESAAGETTTPRLLEVLGPYDGPSRWFTHGAD